MSNTVASDQTKRLELASALSDIAEFLNSTAITRDLASGYSLSDAISDRIGYIGDLANAKKLYAGTGDVLSKQLELAPNGLPTKQAELKILLDRGLSAIASTREIGEVTTKDPSELSDTPTTDQDNPAVLIMEL